MKNNVRFIIIVVSLILVSSLVLTGCMYAVAMDMGEGKPYNLYDGILMEGEHADGNTGAENPEGNGDFFEDLPQQNEDSLGDKLTQSVDVFEDTPQQNGDVLEGDLPQQNEDSLGDKLTQSGEAFEDAPQQNGDAFEGDFPPAGVGTDSAPSVNEEPDGDIFDDDTRFPNTNIIEDAPVSLVEMKKKFDKYLHEDIYKDGRTVTIFTNEQYAALNSLRLNGKRQPLTYDEILYLVNDSINLYFAYERVVLTNSNIDNSLPLMYYNSVSSADKQALIEDGGTVSHIITRDLPENYSRYEDAKKAYDKMIRDIYAIIYYRLYVHDAGFDAITESTNASGDTIVFGNGTKDSEFNSFVPMYKMHLLSTNGGVISGVENRKTLVDEWKKISDGKNYYYSDNYVIKSLDAPLLITYNLHPENMLYEFYISDKIHNITKIFPTMELENMSPSP